MAESVPKFQPQEENRLKRASELPIYTEDNEQDRINPTELHEHNKQLPSFLTNAVHTTRRSFKKCDAILHTLKDDTLDNYSRFNKNVKETITYLREEENSVQRAAAIGLTALVGALCGFRGGFIRKTLYATASGLGMGAVCYPKEAEEYTKLSLDEAKELADVLRPYIFKEDEGVTKKEENKMNENGVEIRDPKEIIEESHENAASKSCHCPIGACLGHSDEPPTSTV